MNSKIFLFFVFFPSLLVGATIPCPPSNEPFCGQLSVEVAALYWKTCRDDRAYAITAPGTPPATLTYSFETDRPKYDWGWRIRAGYQFNPSLFVDAEYASFNQNVEDSSDPSRTTFSFFGIFGPADVNIKNQYQRFRGRGGVALWGGNRADIYAFGGVSWIHLVEKDRLNLLSATPGPQFFHQDSSFNGAGFEAGMGATFQFFRWAGINVEFNGVGALGRRTYGSSVSIINNEIGGGAVSNYPDTHICFPGIDLSAEVFFNFCFRWPFKLAVGYEHHHFFNSLLLAPLFQGELNPLQILTSPASQDIGFGGLYVSLGVAF